MLDDPGNKLLVIRFLRFGLLDLLLGLGFGLSPFLLRLLQFVLSGRFRLISLFGFGFLGFFLLLLKLFSLLLSQTLLNLPFVGDLLGTTHVKLLLFEFTGLLLTFLLSFLSQLFGCEELGVSRLRGLL